MHAYIHIIPSHPSIHPSMHAHIYRDIEIFANVFVFMEIDQ